VHRTREESATPPELPRLPATPLPTTPCSVVWSGGHSYVLEEPGLIGAPSLWVGLDDHGRPTALSADALRDRGWSLTPG
jgi:hypothetical protein